MLDRTRTILEQGMRDGLHIGAQLFVSIAGATIADWAIGEARPGVPMRRDTLMLWMSSVKPIGAVAIAQLRERGKLDLDLPVAHYIPEFGAHGKHVITIRHILTHTGGFRNVPVRWQTAAWGDLLASVCNAHLEPGWTVGKDAGYHPMSGWIILGELIQRIDGRDFSSYTRDEIFLPLDLTDSWCGMTPRVYGAYGDRIGEMQNTEIQPPASAGLDTAERASLSRPGSNGRGPIRQLARFYESLQTGGVITSDSIKLFTARQRVGAFDKTFTHVMDWGLGFMVDSNQYGIDTVPYGYGRYCSSRTFGHGGNQSSIGFCDPAHNLVVTWVCNGMPGEPAHQRRSRSINNAIYEDLDLRTR